MEPPAKHEVLKYMFKRVLALRELLNIFKRGLQIVEEVVVKFS